MKKQSIATLAVLSVMLLLVFSLAGCSGSDGAAGVGVSPPSTGTVSGTVTSAVGAVPLANVAVITNPVVTGATTTTDAAGAYSLSLPGGSYTVTFTLSKYTTATANVNVANGVPSPMNATMALAASGAPSVTVVASGNDIGYTQPFTATATATSPIGATLTYAWTGAVTSGNTTTALYSSAAFTTALNGTAAPSTNPGAYVTKFVPNWRLEVLPINADTRGAAAAKVTVTDGQGGSTSASVTVNSAAPQPGVRQLTLGVSAYLNSGTSTTTATWSMTKPAASTATISALTGTTRFATFKPDVEGKYVVTMATSTTTKTIDLYAGKFVGAISGGTYTSKTFSSDDPKAGMWFDPADAGKMGYFKGGTASSWTYTNWPMVTKAGACGGCHNNGTTAIDMWPSWGNTSHATFFSRGLEGITGNSASCVTCHTVGSDGVNVGNGGYDDLVASTGFVYTKGIGAWSRMTASFPTVAAVANIQCENCHGANSTSASDLTVTGHGTAGSGGGTYVSNETSTLGAVRVSFSSDICGTCHSSGTGHHNFSEWEVSGHGNKSLAIGHANCACHDAQAFAIQLDQLKAGNSHYMVDPDKVVSWATPSALLTNGNAGYSTSGYAVEFPASTNKLVSFPAAGAQYAEPITCTVCHDPHDATNPNQLRVYSGYTNTPIWGQFTFDGMGKGAICLMCHSGRNVTKCGTGNTSNVSVISGVTGTGYCNQPHSKVKGGAYLREDLEPFNGGEPEDYGNAHDQTAGSVLMGRNAYFMGSSLPMLSKHANVEDACVGCHVTLNPTTRIDSHGATAVNGHEMGIDAADKTKLCANCHSSTVDGEALAEMVVDQMAALKVAMAANFANKVFTSAPAATFTLYYVSNWTSPTGTWVQQVDMKLDNGMTSSSTSTTTPTLVQSGGGTSVTLYNVVSNTSNTDMTVSIVAKRSYSFNSLVMTNVPPFVAYVQPTEDISKAAWNYALLNKDGSEGVHNPSFVLGVLSNSIAAMY